MFTISNIYLQSAEKDEKDNIPKSLFLDKHVNYLRSYGLNKDDYVSKKTNKQFEKSISNCCFDICYAFLQTYCMTEHLRMSGMYWGLTALDIMNKLEKNGPELLEILDFIKKCQSDCGGISACIDHDPHILFTLSAVQILCIYDALDTIDVDKVVEYIKQRQQPDGSFTGDVWGEVDTRFSFCAVATLSLLVKQQKNQKNTQNKQIFLCRITFFFYFLQGRLDAIDVEKAVSFVISCMNFDGGFGSKPGSESHAGLIYCCVGLLSITGNFFIN